MASTSRAVSIRRRGKRSAIGADSPRQRAVAIAVGAAFAASAWQAFANPTGATVAAGSATISTSGKALTVTNSPGAVINWQQFSIQKDEVTRFIQQNAASAVLNRVISQNPSQILGTLQSNGRVFLINPSGITFGAGATIDVAGFAASTLNMSDADFVSGRMRFIGTGAEGKINNAGTIRTPEGGHVYLVAPKVENEATGVITSPKGEVVIAAGKTVELVNARTPDLRVEYTAPDNEAVNAGQVIASGGRVGIYGTLIKNSGLVSATSATMEGGKIVLRATKDVTLDPTSKIEANGTKGGKVDIKADTGTLVAGGLIEATGFSDIGGEVLLAAPQVVQTGSIKTDGVAGGKIAIEAAAVQQSGALSAKGSTGAGGAIKIVADRIEQTSSAVVAVDSASSAGGSVEFAAGQDDGESIFTSATVTATGDIGGQIKVTGRDVALIEAKLDASGENGGGTILVGGGWQGKDPLVPNSQRNYFGLASAINADARRRGNGGTVVLWSDGMTRAHGSISARGGAEGGDGGSVETSGKQYLEVTRTPDITAPNGRGGNWLIDPNNIEIVAGGVPTNINAVSPFESTDDTAQLGVDLITAALTGGATVTVQTGTGGNDGEDGDITLSTTLNYNGKGSNTLQLFAHNDIIINGQILDGTPGGGDVLNLELRADHITPDGAGAIQINSSIDTSGGSFIASAAESITVAAAVTAGAGNVTLNSAGAVTQGAGDTITAAGLELLGAGPFTLTDAGNNVATIAANTTGAVSYRDADALAVGTVNTVGITTGGTNLTLQTGSGLTVANAINAGTGTTTLNSTAGGVTATVASITSANLQLTGAGTFNLSNAGNDIDTLAVNTTGGAVTVTNVDALTVGTVTTAGIATGGGAFSLTAGATGIALNQNVVTDGGQIDLNSAVTLTNNVTTSSGTGNTTFASSVNGAFDLVVNSSGTTTFAGLVGNSTALSSLTLDAGTLAMNGGAITTTGAQTYNDAVTLGAGTALTSTGGGQIQLASTVNGAQTLAVNTSGITRFDGAVGAGSALTSLTTDAGGTTQINAGAITTTSAQTYNDAVTLGAGATLTSTGSGQIQFVSTLNGAQALVVNTSGSTRFDDTVGATTRLASLTTDAGGSTAINGNQVATSGAQTYNDAVTIAGATTIRSGGLTTINSTFNRNGSVLTLEVNDLDITASGSLTSAAGANAVITTDTATPATAITLGGAGGLSITDAEINRIANVPTLTIGDTAHTGPITVAGNTNVAPSGLTSLVLTNNGNINLTNATLTSPVATTLSSAAGSINFNAGGRISAGGQTVSLTSTAGAINGNATDAGNFIAGAPTPNVVSQSLVAAAASGIGHGSALTTQITDLSATTASNNIQIYNAGATNVAGGAGTFAVDTCSGTAPATACPSGPSGDLTLVSTGAITQTKQLRTDALTAVTVNTPGAAINLGNTSNYANTYAIYACLALPGGCPTDANLSPAIGNGSSTTYANGSITYRDANGANLSGIGTISTFTTYTNGPLTVAANNISASNITLEALGDITINLGSDITKINNTASGSFNLTSGGSINFVNTSGKIGTSGSTFNHDLNLAAAGNITVENSIFQGVKNLTLAANQAVSMNGGAVNVAGFGSGIALQGNYIVQTGGDLNVTGGNFSLLGGSMGGLNQSANGQELTVAGTVNFLNSGVIAVQAGTATAGSASGSRLTGGTINIGTSGGASNPTQLVVKGGTNAIGYVTNNSADPLIELRQADGLIESLGDMKVYLRSAAAPAGIDAEPFGGQYSLIIRGGEATANDNGGSVRYVTALGAMRAKNMTVETDGTILIEGGTSNVNSSAAFAATSGVVLVETNKTLKAGGALIVKGGRANVLPSLSSVSARNALAVGQLDPSRLVITAKQIVLQGGTQTGPSGSLTSARIDAGDEIIINLTGPAVSYTYANTGSGSKTLNGNFFMIGSNDSGFFDSNNVPLGGGGAPIVYPITVNGASFARDQDIGRGAGIVQTGLSTFDESLLSYIIFAANEETRSARIRKGLGDGDDLGAPACK